MTAHSIIITTLVYFGILMLISRWMSGKGDNDAFFRGSRKSPWWAVAFGMIGASLSGVSFVSVPGMVTHSDMTYMQMCIGFFFGYLIVAYVLLPLYYKLNLTSIYTYLNERFSLTAYRTGASFFLLSKMLGAAARLYLVCIILQQYVLGAMGIPFWLTALIIVFLIWIYTFRGGIKTLVWTDSLQTFCLLATLLLIIYRLCMLNDLDLIQAWQHVVNNPHSRWLVWDDWSSRQHFVKQFLSGVFIVIVMTGLDQDMMQKNLTCKSLRDAQKDMITYGFFFIPINWLFMAMGVLLITFAQSHGIVLPAQSDSILPLFCAQGYLGQGVLVLFTIGIIAAAFSSADSALTALTTSFCIDILDVEHRYNNPVRVRCRVHVVMALLFAGFILLFGALNSTSLLDAVYIIASYTYGPLLGLFVYGLFMKGHPRSWCVPFICIASPVLCYALDAYTVAHYDYKFGYELLMLNGMLTFLGLAVSARRVN